MEMAPVLRSKETELSQQIDNAEYEGIRNIMGHQRINIFGEGSLHVVVDESADF